ncbi:hypothetical protein [Helicobacter zhangjianzhongii]|uniref:Uncharacterized protein n=1 Tax=Helicobacter zhangjianzhongii TaxID=2974574 RepID=A0ACC6FUR1_9HELI|nr:MULTISPECIES: hypothetical protein [unclassified Helicobacter]MDL0080407.1 hypothetical protein [Helicobacter sp. CPD2-1]MDL0082441.1 hypothetical protein [Helicobacter sp. XJK30-2]
MAGFCSNNAGAESVLDNQARRILGFLTKTPTMCFVVKQIGGRILVQNKRSEVSLEKPMPKPSQILSLFTHIVGR